MKQLAHSKFTGFENMSAQFRVGVVYDCNPTAYTVDVKLPGAEFLAGVPVLNVYGASYGQDVTWLQNLRGAGVLLILVSGRYYVLATLPEQLVSSDTSAAVDLHEGEFGGGHARTYQTEVYRNFHGGRPQDFYPGDKVLSSGDAQLGLFREGVAKLKASPMAQFILGKLKDWGRLVVRTFQMFTDFGEIHFTHDNGRVGIHLAGGADFSEETHPTKALWTVQVWLGDVPSDEDARLYVRVNDKTNAQFVTMTMDIQGNMTLETSNDYEETIQGDRSENVLGDSSESVQGTRVKNVVEDEIEGTQGNRTMSAGGTLTIKSDVEVAIEAPKVTIK